MRDEEGEGQPDGEAHGGDLGEARRLFPGAPEPWIDLSTGINPIPYPHLELEASALARLPAPGDLRTLREAAAAAFGARAEEIVAVPGTQAVIELLPRLRAPGRVAVLAPTYGGHAPAWRRAGHAVREVANLAAASSAEVLVVVNPNNPDGQLWPRSELAAAAAALDARDGWLVVDEAFADLEPIASVARERPAGTIVLRSFGKAYGLAGLRLGFAVAAAPLAAEIAAAFGAWPVSGPALEIGCRALADTAWRAEAAADRAVDARRLDALLRDAGAEIVGGTRLFRFVRFEDAPACFARLGQAGIWTRRFAHAPSNLRFGLPPDADAWARLVAALRA